MSASPLGDQEFPGDAAAVREMSQSFQRMAQNLLEQAEQVLRLKSGNGSWQGQANRQFAENVSPLPTTLRQAHQRYETAGGHLRVYADVLADSKTQAQRIRSDLEGAQGRVGAASRGLAQQHQFEAAEQRRVNGDPTSGPPRPWPDADYSPRLAAANAEVSDLKKQLAQLHAAFDECASATAQKLRDAANVGKDPGGVAGWLGKQVDNLKKVVSAVGEWAAKHADLLSALSDGLAALAGVLALVALVAVPGLGLAAFAFGLAALGVGALQYAGGDKSGWVFLGESALTLVPFGLGRVASGPLRSAAKATSPAARMASGTLRLMASGKTQAAQRLEDSIRASAHGRVNVWLGRSRWNGVKMPRLTDGKWVQVRGRTPGSIDTALRVSPAATRWYRGKLVVETGDAVRGVWIGTTGLGQRIFNPQPAGVAP